MKEVSADRPGKKSDQVLENTDNWRECMGDTLSFKWTGVTRFQVSKAETAAFVVGMGPIIAPQKTRSLGLITTTDSDTRTQEYERLFIGVMPVTLNWTLSVTHASDKYSGKRYIGKCTFSRNPDTGYDNPTNSALQYERADGKKVKCSETKTTRTKESCRKMVVERALAGVPEAMTSTSHPLEFRCYRQAHEWTTLSNATSLDVGVDSWNKKTMTLKAAEVICPDATELKRVRGGLYTVYQCGCALNEKARTDDIAVEQLEP